ncbi:MAG: CBS domain-containing protein, partial [Mitsuokella sp.]
MTKDVITVQPNASIREIAECLVEKRISGVPVVDGDGRVVGIV